MIITGFIGLGNMGGAMAANLIKKGFQVSVYDIDSEKAAALSAGGANNIKICSSIKELAAEVDVILTSLPGPEQIKAVAFGEKGLLAHARPGSIWIDTSTTSLENIEAIIKNAAERSVTFLSAPVSGGVLAAREGTLALYVGGEKKAFEKITPILEAIGAHIYYVGAASHAILAKLLINYLCFVNTKALDEVLSLAREAGMDQRQLVEMIQSGSGSSWVAEKLLPLIFAGTMPAGFTLQLAHKDASLIHDLQSHFTTPLESSQRLREVLEEACAQNGGHKSFTHIIKNINHE